MHKIYIAILLILFDIINNFFNTLQARQFFSSFLLTTFAESVMRILFL